MKAKLIIHVEGEEAYDFLRDIEANLPAMRDGWNRDDPKAVTALASKTDHGW